MKLKCAYIGYLNINGRGINVVIPCKLYVSPKHFLECCEKYMNILHSIFPKLKEFGIDRAKSDFERRFVREKNVTIHYHQLENKMQKVDILCEKSFSYNLDPCNLFIGV